MTRNRATPSSCSTSTTRCSTTTGCRPIWASISRDTTAPATRDRYWEIFEKLRSRTRLCRLSRRAGALPARGDARSAGAAHGELAGRLSVRRPPLSRRARRRAAHAARWGPTVILSDGDAVFQPRKVERSGLWRAVRRPRADLRPQGTGTRRMSSATVSRQALRHDRRQAAHPGRHEAGLGRARHDGVSRDRATTRTDPEDPGGAIRRPTSRWSASATCCSTIYPAFARP